jgi:hypothetical protein
MKGIPDLMCMSQIYYLSLGLEDLSADVKGGGVYPTNQQLIFLFEEILKKKNLGRGERKQIWGEEK